MSKESPDNWEPSPEDLAAAERLMREIGADNVFPTEEHLGIERAREVVRIEDGAEKRRQLQEKLVDFYAYLATTPPDFEYREHLGLLHAAMQRLAADVLNTDRGRAELEYEVEQLIERILFNLRKGGGQIRGAFIEPDFRAWPGQPPKGALVDHVDMSKEFSEERYLLRADIYEKLCQVSDVLNEIPKTFDYRYIAMKVLGAMTELTSNYAFIDRATMLGTQRRVDEKLTEALYHLRKAGGPLTRTEGRSATEEYFPPR